MAKHKTYLNNSKWSLLRCNINELSRNVDSSPKKNALPLTTCLNQNINWKMDIYLDISSCQNIGRTNKCSHCVFPLIMDSN